MPPKFIPAFWILTLSLSTGACTGTSADSKRRRGEARRGVDAVASLDGAATSSLSSEATVSKSGPRSPADKDRKRSRGKRPAVKRAPTASPAAGLLTAGSWDDVANFSVFTKFVTNVAKQSLRPGQSQTMRSIPRRQLIIRLRGGDNHALENTELRWKYQDGSLSRETYVSKSDGSISLNSSWDRIPEGDKVEALIRAPGQMLNHTVTIKVAKDQSDLTIKAPRLIGKRVKRLEICLVIDCTGSMSDELKYLQAEIGAIVDKVKRSYPAIEQRLALVVYRDKGDAYVSKLYDFQNKLPRFQELLDEQRATGGGDYPEALDQALNDAASLTWTRAESVRLCFLVADAPPHNTREKVAQFAITKLRSQGVVVYPIAASGVQSQAELVMRQAAFVTGGKYLFLTDDSGIGNKHAEPHIPEYDVEKLSKLMTRMIVSELAGELIPARPEDIIRSVRRSQSGVKRRPS
jgi:hypothetical protein